MTTTVKQKYRDPSIPPQVLATIYIGGDIAMHVAAICLSADYKQDEGYKYTEWLKSWKEAYKALSAIINETKRQSKEAEVNSATRARSLLALRYLANSMLNARQYARDRRRAVLDAQYEANR